jgi:hypothetical protein
MRSDTAFRGARRASGDRRPALQAGTRAARSGQNGAQQLGKSPAAELKQHGSAKTVNRSVTLVDWDERREYT